MLSISTRQSLLFSMMVTLCSCVLAHAQGSSSTKSSKAGNLVIPEHAVGADGPAGTPRVDVAIFLTGSVKAYLRNSAGEIDGLLLSDGKQVRLPPHLGLDLKQSVKVGDSICATVEPGIQSVYGQEFRVITLNNTNSQEAIVDQPPLTPRSENLKLQKQIAQGRLTQFLVDRTGTVSGLLLSGGSQVRLPEGTGKALSLQMRVGDNVRVQGLGTLNADGCCVDMSSVSINGQAIHLNVNP